MPITRISPNLWFDSDAEDAAQFYTSIFKNSKITHVSRYSEVGFEQHHRPPGSVMVVAFELDGLPFTALNGGPMFKFSEAISFIVNCDTQDEIDYYWNALSEGGNPKAQQCGWLKDKFGLSWQIVPSSLADMMTDTDQARSSRVMAAVLNMKKIDLPTLQRTYRGD